MYEQHWNSVQVELAIHPSLGITVSLFACSVINQVILPLRVRVVSPTHTPGKFLKFILIVESIADIHPDLPHLTPAPFSDLHHIIVCVHGYAYAYPSSLVPLFWGHHSPPASLWAHACVSLDLLCSSLDSTCDWDHMILVFFWPTYFT